MTSQENDDLRTRLARSDPMPGSVPVDPSTSPRAQQLLERVMLTNQQTPTTATAAARWRQPAVLVAAAAAVLAIGVGSVVANRGGNTAPTKPTTTLTLRGAGGADGGGGVSIGSCIRFSIDILRGMPVAFGGTVTDVQPDAVSLTVDRWFKGGNAQVVTVSTPPSNTSVGPVEFVKGQRYLVTATDGTVNSCGYTGPATPELERSFEQAFAP